MNIEELKNLIDSTDRTLHTTNEDVKSLLGDPKMNDSLKKNLLIEYLGATEAQLMIVRNDLAAELDRLTRKKFWQFWK